MICLNFDPDSQKSVWNFISGPGLEQRNTQILELYLLLHKIQLYRGMDILKQYVPPKHHLLVRYYGTVLLNNLSFL
jgi:hypothetical protein